MKVNAKSITTEKWTDRQSVVKLKNGRWQISFLATTTGSISDMGGMVAEYKTPKSDEAQEVMFAWITSGIIPALSETHAPQWFKTI